MSKKSFILFSCILTGFGTQEAHAYQNPEETRGRCTYIDTARQYLENAKNLIDNELYNSATVLKEGIAAYQRCVEPDDSNFQTLSSLYYNLGFAYYHVSDYEHSLAYFYKIVKLQGTNPRMQAKAYIGISNVFNSLKNPQESIHALKRAKGINQSLQDRGIEIGVLNNLANAHAINGEYDSVLYCLQRAYEYSFLLRTRPGNRFPSCSTWPMRCKCCPGEKNLNIATGKPWTKPANCTTIISATKSNTGWPWSC